jgi:hypothetical protein
VVPWACARNAQLLRHASARTAAAEWPSGEPARCTPRTSEDGSAQLPGGVAGGRSRYSPARRDVPVTHTEDRRKNSRCLRWPHPPPRDWFPRTLSAWPFGLPDARSPRIALCLILAQEESAPLGTRLARQLPRTERHRPKEQPSPSSQGMRLVSARRLLLRLQAFITPGDAMDPREVAAHFAALVWFSKRDPKTQEEAVPFANDNGPAFLPLAHQGLGRLLIKMATPRVAPAPTQPPPPDPATWGPGGRLPHGVLHPGGAQHRPQAYRGRKWHPPARDAATPLVPPKVAFIAAGAEIEKPWRVAAPVGRTSDLLRSSLLFEEPSKKAWPG